MYLGKALWMTRGSDRRGYRRGCWHKNYKYVDSETDLEMDRMSTSTTLSTAEGCSQSGIETTLDVEFRHTTVQ